MLKVGVVGAGGISGAHFPAWATMDDIELTCVCDVRTSQLERFNDKRTYTDFDEMISKEELDIIDICLPTDMHADFAVKALDKGINVLCEKPISLKYEDVDRVYEAAKRNNVKFMVAQVIRFWPEYVKLKEIYDNKTYGNLLSGHMRRLSTIPPKTQGNWMHEEKRSGLVPYDLHIHDVDFMVYLFGEPKDSVVRRTKRPEQDAIAVIYDYPDFYISAEASWYAGKYPFKMEFRFQFEKAVVAMENDSFMVYPVDGEAINLKEVSDSQTGDIGLPKTDAYGAEIRYFVDCVKNNMEPDIVKPEELKTVIRVLSSF